MNKRLFISTNAFEQYDFNVILNVCKENGFKNIELSSCKTYNQDVYNLLVELHNQDSFHFLLHNYFPPKDEPFVLNLASNDDHILKLSRQHCQYAIALSAKLGAPFYSVHAGHCYHARPDQLGQKIDKYDAFPIEQAREIFLESIQLLADYALKHGITLAIENHALAPFHLIEGKNELLLGVTAEDLLHVIERAQRHNLAILIDVGHLKVSARTLCFSPHEFMRDLSLYTRILHLSENSGDMDEHQILHEDSWFWEILSLSGFRDTFWVFEGIHCGLAEIMKQITLINSYL